MSISFNGYEKSIITFEAGDGLAVGCPVTLNSNGEAVPASANSKFIGICTAIRNGWASVQTGGYATVKYSDSAPSYGVTMLATGANKTVKPVSENGIYYKVVKVDTTNTTAGIIL
ncbi:MAG: hypothetical protein IJR60_05020 [Eubacterium sp.]|nr:hypothetical protein [Eubacterium sp.]